MKQNIRVLSFLLAVCLIAGFLPATYVAAETTVQIVENIGDGQFLYYGENKWLVLDADADNNGEAGIFLLSADVASSDIQFEDSGLTNVWDGSDAKAWAEAFATETFTEEELSAIKAVTKNDAAGTYSNLAWKESNLNNEQVFFLSAEEVSIYLNADHAAAGNGWWLRSGCADNTGIYAGVVSDIGIVGTPHVAAKYDARPAMNLDSSKIAMFKSATDGYKVVLLDETTDFSASAEVGTQDKGYTDWTVEVTYAGAMTGENAYVSAAIIDADGNTVYYANVANNSESGTATVTIPDGLLGKYTLKLFSEQVNGDNKTDYATGIVSFDFTVDDGMGDVISWNLALGDDLSLNFYVKAEQSILSDGYVSITVGEGDAALHKISEAAQDAEGNYIFSVNVAAAQMTDAIKLQFSIGEEKGAVHTYSVRQYADTILAGDYDEELKALVKEMLNYGGKAQLYFNYNTENLANKGITVEEATVPTENDKVAVSGSVEGIRFYGASLVFTNKTAVRYYFAVSGDIDSYSFKVGDSSYKAVAKDGMYYVEIPGINPQDLAEEIVLTVSDGTDSMAVGYSPLNYIVRMYAKGTDSLKNLLAAMYGYHLKAAHYMKYVGATEGVKLWWAYNTENLMQDFTYDYDRDRKLRFYGIQGDVESIQLMITPEEDVLDYDFTMGDIATQSGSVISADCFEIYAEHYMEITSSYNPNTVSGYYPDALVPLENYRSRRCNSIHAGENQGVWLNVNIPADAEAGTYTGEGKLTLDGKEYAIPIALTVYNVAMPEEVHPQSAYLIWYNYVESGEGTTDPQMYENYFWFLANKRITPDQPGPHITNNYAAYADYVAENLAQNPMIPSYGLPYALKNIDGVNHLDENQVMAMLNQLADKNIALRQAGNTSIDLFQKAYYYLGSICDEPDSPEDFELVRESDLIISNAKFAVAERLNNYPDLKESLLSLKHIVTTSYSEEMIGTDTQGGVQTWCPKYRFFHTEAQRQEYADRQNSQDRLMGENVWWYGCLDPRAPYPTYHLDDDLISSRIISWMQYDYGIEGELYWCVNWYTSYNGERDVWTDAETVPQTPGDGYLVYPGKEFGVQGPISTLRLESIRESREDYEYLWLFEQKIEEYNRANGTAYDANELLGTYFDGLYEGTIPTRDSDVFHQKRLALLRVVEALHTDLNTTVESLVN